ncbi:MAG: hypothetical protein SFT94_10580, partial [Pseudanabaenaceae cyanobacterium bins.68]|nr:hypothetical protein [Pseudanabaenaceae cyanobacterium bins.68]
NSIQAVVGSSVTYQVQIEFDQNGITHATSNYNGDRLSGAEQGWCRYTVAALLACLHQPELVTTKQPITSLLEQLQRDQLQTLIENLVKFEPNLAEEIELAAEFLLASNSPQTIETVPKFEQPVEETAPKKVESYIAYLTDRLEQILLNQGEDRRADLLALLDDCGNGEYLRPSLESLEFLQRFGQALFTDLDAEPGVIYGKVESHLTRIWLSLSLSDRTAHQTQLLEQIQAWQTQSGNQIDLSMLQTAIEHGWEYPPLVQALQGNTSELGAWVDQVPSFADRLAQIRLEVLAANKLTQAYLNLAAAEGQVGSYLRALVEVGELEEALKLLPQLAPNPTEVLEIAQALAAQKHLDQALDLVRRSLDLPEQDGKPELGRWVLERAGITPPVAFDPNWSSAHQYLFGRAMDVIYGTTAGFHGKYWAYTSRGDFYEAINLFLAQDLAPNGEYPRAILNSLFQNLGQIQLERAIARISTRVEEIMNLGKANTYEQAIAWLKYVQKGMKPEQWQEYRQQLLRTYAKKRKLVELLQQLT